MVVSSGLPIVFSSHPLPRNLRARSGVLCGWMKISTPSSSALAQNGWNFGSENSSPATLAPTAAPRRPSFFTPSSSCWTARSGNCSAIEANATKRSGYLAQNPASASFWILITFSATSRSARYHAGLMLSASTSMPCASISRMRRSPTSPIPGPRWSSTFSPSRAYASGITQWAWTSIVFTRRPPTTTSRRRPAAAVAWPDRPALARAFPRAAGAFARARARACAAPSSSQSTNAISAMTPAVLLSNAPRVLIGVPPWERVSAGNAAYHSASLSDAVARRSAPPGGQGELRRLAPAHVDGGRGQHARDLLHLAHEHARVVLGRVAADRRRAVEKARDPGFPEMARVVRAVRVRQHGADGPRLLSGHGAVAARHRLDDRRVGRHVEWIHDEATAPLEAGGGRDLDLVAELGIARRQ